MGAVLSSSPNAREFDERELEAAIRAEFLAEAQDLLREAEPAFLSLEQNPANHALMDQIFRTVHTFKGSAGVAGFAGLAAFAHTFESLLSAIRANQVAVDARAIDVLLAGHDVLGRYVASLCLDPNAAFDVRSVVQSIESLLPARLLSMPRVKEAPLTVPKSKLRPILVVDDAPEIRRHLCSILTVLGAPIIEAANGLDALRVVDGIEISLLVTDQKMPGLDGLGLIAKLRKHQPDLPILVISGATRRAEALGFLHLGIFGFLDKPFEDAEVVNTARNALRFAEDRAALHAAFHLALRAYFQFRRIDSARADGDHNASGPAEHSLEEHLRALGEVIRGVLDHNPTLSSKEPS